MSRKAGLALAIMTAGVLASGAAAFAQTAPATPNTRVGRLQCQVSGSVGFVFGSTKDLTCTFAALNGPTETYVGEIQRFGIDIGVTGPGVMIWDVINTGNVTGPAGSLEGTYGGGSSNIAAGVGVGSALLVGGSTQHIALQPLSVEVNSGVNVAAGIAQLTLRRS